jgi:hypothetical protein
MGDLTQHCLFPASTIDSVKYDMNIQEAIKSGKPFRRRGWPDDGIYVVYVEHDIVLTLENDFAASIVLDVQDILAEDWYIREDVHTHASKYMSL